MGPAPRPRSFRFGSHQQADLALGVAKTTTVGGIFFNPPAGDCECGKLKMHVLVRFIVADFDTLRKSCEISDDHPSLA